VLLGAHTSNQT